MANNANMSVSISVIAEVLVGSLLPFRLKADPPIARACGVPRLSWLYLPDRAGPRGSESLEKHVYM